MSGVSAASQVGKSAFDWSVYSNRRTALQHLKRNCILVDTIIETEDGQAHELVHSQVMSAFGDRLTQFIAQNGVPIVRLNNGNAPHDGPPHQYHASAFQKTTNTLKLVRPPKINRYTLGILVDCAYSGYIRTDLSSGGIWQVLDMADHYEMVDVQRACCAFLIKNLNRSNCVHFYHIGIKHRHPLQRCAWHQIRANFKHILADNLRRLAGTEPAASLPAPPRAPETAGRQATVASASAAASPAPAPTPSSPAGTTVTAAAAAAASTAVAISANAASIPGAENSLASIRYEHFEPLLMHDRLNVDNEESVWGAIKLWCQHGPAVRQQQVTGLLPCIRFARLHSGAEFCSRRIWRDPLILNNKQAQHQLAVLDRNQRDFLSSLNRYASGSVGPVRDGFNLPCAVNPRQLRPRIPHSILLAIGGWQQGQPTTLIESYDLNCNLWFDSKHRIVSSLAYHGIECIEGRLFICGGTDGRDIHSQLFVFDPTSGQCVFLKSMREDRCYVSTAYLEGHLYAMGGHNGVQRLRSAERYNVLEDSWEHVQDMNVARSDASACVHQRLIYIAGGLNDQVIESSVEFYNPANDSWTFVSSMLVPRTSFTLLLYRDSLVAIGGNNGTERLNSVERYSFASNTWSVHSQMRHRRSTFSAALVDDSKLFVVGGYNGQTPFAQVEMFDEASNQWVPMQRIRYDRSGLKLVVVKDLPNAAEYTFLGSGGNAGEYRVQEAASP